MKWKYLLIMAVAFLVFLPVAYADGFYYENSSGNYMLCESRGNCIEVRPGQSGVTFNFTTQQIAYDNVIYTFNSVEQDFYNNSLNGQTRMFYYNDSSGRYVLCNAVGDCERYTFDQLSSRGAIINAGVSITLSNGEVYLYKQSQAPGSGSSSDDNDVSGTTPSTGGSTSDSDSETCGRLKEPLQFIGNIVLVVKILIPLIIIALGMVDFFKAITSSKDDEIRKAAKSFAFRVVAGVIIFFIPTLVSLVFSLISSWANLKGEFDACQKCILNVRSCE